MKSKIILFIAVFTIYLSYNQTINIEYENTWKRYTNYIFGSEVLNDRLYVNSYGALEVYDISATGSLQLNEILEFPTLIHNLDLDLEDEMVYIVLSPGISGICEHIKAFKITDSGLEYRFTYDPGINFSYDDFIVPLENEIILGKYFPTNYYQRNYQIIEELTYNYQYILGACDRILVEYDLDLHQLNFYDVLEVNEPQLLYQYDYDIYSTASCFVRKISDNCLYLIINDDILIFEISVEQNINYNSSIIIPDNDDYIRNPIQYSDTLMYIGTRSQENYVYDLQNPFLPELMCQWTAENEENEAYSLNNDRFLYKSQRYDGLTVTDLNDLPEPACETLKEYIPISSNGFIDGIGYKNEGGYLYRILPDISEIEIICEVPIERTWSYFLQEHYLYIEGQTDMTGYFSIVDLNMNQLINHIQFDNRIWIVHNGLMISENEDQNLIEIFQADQNQQLNQIMELPFCGSLFICYWDEVHVWISEEEGDYLFNTLSMSIDQEFDNIFSPDLYKTPHPYKYDNRLIVVNSQMDEPAIVGLYDITDIQNPILLDQKTEPNNVNYFFLEDYILESHGDNIVKLYNRFDVSFMVCIQELDFNTPVMDIIIDESHQRIALSSYYYLKTFLYENTENGLSIIPAYNSELICYPNPFNPEVNISFSSTEDTENTEINIYNIKGQQVKSFKIQNSVFQIEKVVWDGRDDRGNQVSSGVYFIKLQIGKEIITNKVIMLK